MHNVVNSQKLLEIIENQKAMYMYNNLHVDDLFS